MYKNSREFYRNSSLFNEFPGIYGHICLTLRHLKAPKIDNLQPNCHERHEFLTKFMKKSSFSIKMQLNVNNFDEFLAKLHEIEEKWA